jgi:hypothetical protein
MDASMTQVYSRIWLEQRPAPEKPFPTPWTIDGADCVNDATGRFVAHIRDLGDEDLMRRVVAAMNAQEK